MVVINGRPEFVKNIYDEGQVSAVYEVIDKLEKAKEELTANGISQYTYYYDHEKIRVNRKSVKKKTISILMELHQVSDIIKFLCPCGSGKKFKKCCRG